MKPKLASLIIPAIILLSAILFLKNSPEEQKENKLSITMNQITPTPSLTPEPSPALEINTTKTYTAIINTEKGKIEIALTADKTPITVNNFVILARKGFYNNTIFHRTIKSFMIQGGDPKGDGTGGPGYQFKDEPFEGEYTRGTVAMANTGPNTNGSQFFIMHQDYQLPKNYVIFGQVVKGIEIVDAIASAPVKQSPTGENSAPVTPVKILSATITEK